MKKIGRYLVLLASCGNYMKTKSKIGPKFLKIIVSIFGIGFAIFSMMILNIIISHFEFIGLIVFMMMSMFALMFSFYGLESIRQIVVRPDQKIIEIVYLGVFRKRFENSEISGFCSYPFSNRIGTYAGILLEFINGKQIQISEFDTRNFKEIETVISSFVESKKDLKLKIWTKFNKILLGYAVFMILLMIIGKLLNLK